MYRLIVCASAAVCDRTLKPVSRTAALSQKVRYPSYFVRTPGIAKFRAHWSGPGPTGPSRTCHRLSAVALCYVLRCEITFHIKFNIGHPSAGCCQKSRRRSASGSARLGSLGLRAESPARRSARQAPRLRFLHFRSGAFACICASCCASLVARCVAFVASAFAFHCVSSVCARAFSLQSSIFNFFTIILLPRPPLSSPWHCQS